MVNVKYENVSFMFLSKVELDIGIAIDGIIVVVQSTQGFQIGGMQNVNLLLSWIQDFSDFDGLPD